MARVTKTRNRPSIKITPRAYDTSGLPERFFNPGELEMLLHLYEMADALTVVEFGVNTGRNVVAACRNIPSIKHYVGVDVTSDYVPAMKAQRNEVPDEPGCLARRLPEFQLIVTPRGTFDLSADDLPCEVEVVFIDADHSRAGVLNDRALAKSILRDGGLIIYHDDNCLDAVEVTETLNELCEAGAEIKHIDGTWLSFEVHHAGS